MPNTASITKSSVSNMPRKLLFIVNPNAGKKISSTVIDIIRAEFPENIYYQIVIWKNKDHFDEITELLKTQDYTDAIAVGGDGTVNHVAKTILNTNIRLGIVPIGSGNGLARSLGLSMKIEEVIHQIALGKTGTIDSGVVNGVPFFCTSGIGFDAHIGHLFASSKKRGLQSYVKIILSQLLNYRAKEYILTINNRTFKRKAFLVTVANAGQYGNDFYIAPQASLSDGLFHVVILKPFKPHQIVGLMYHILTRKAYKNSCIETFVTNQLTIERQNKDTIHFDGEPMMQTERVVFENKPDSLKVILG